MSLTKYAEVAQQERSVEVLDSFVVPRNAGSQRLARMRRKAHRHEFEYTPRRGYIYVRSRAISSRCNDNFDEFPASEIKKAYRTFIGKPVFVNHHNSDHRRARGVIIDAALHEDTNPDGSEDVWAEVLMEVDAVRFPVLAREVKAGNIARTSMGTDVEYSVCTACGNKAVTPADYCQHIPKLKGMKIKRFNAASGGYEEVLIAERCYGLRFFENSLLVEDPADPTAYVLGVDSGEGISAAAARAVIDEDRPAAPTPATGRTAARSIEETVPDPMPPAHGAVARLLAEAAYKDKGDFLDGLDITNVRDIGRHPQAESLESYGIHMGRDVIATGNYNPEDFNSFAEETLAVPLSDLRYKEGQTHVLHHYVEHLAAIPQSQFDQSDLPFGQRMPDGSVLLMEGHHRAAAASLRGDRTLKMTVYGEWGPGINKRSSRTAGIADYFDVVVLHRGDEAGLVEYGSADLKDACDHAAVIWMGEQPVSCHVINRGTDTVFWSNGANTTDGRLAAHRHHAYGEPDDIGWADNYDKGWGAGLDDRAAGRPPAVTPDNLDGGPLGATKWKRGYIDGYGRAAARRHEAGIGEVFDFLKGGRDERNQCGECGRLFRWVPDLHRFVCPAGHKSVPSFASRTAAIDVPEGYVFLQFGSHRASDNFARGIGVDARDYPKGVKGVVYLSSFDKPHLLAVPAELWAQYEAANRTGNGLKGIRVMKRRPDLSHYRRPMFGSRHHGYGEVKAPANVDTLRAETCPVCGDDEAFNGEKCSVCGYTQPPSQFTDPDLTKAREMDLRQDNQQNGVEVAPQPEEPAADQSLQCSNCGEVFGAEGDNAETGPEEEPQEPGSDQPRGPVPDPEDEEGAEDDGDQPRDLSDLEDATDEDLFDDEKAEEESKAKADNPFTKDEDDEENEDTEEVEDPAVGEARITAEPEDDLTGPVEANQTCPICGEGVLIPRADQSSEGGEPKVKEVGTDPTKAKEIK